MVLFDDVSAEIKATKNDVDETIKSINHYLANGVTHLVAEMCPDEQVYNRLITAEGLEDNENVISAEDLEEKGDLS